MKTRHVGSIFDSIRESTMRMNANMSLHDIGGGIFKVYNFERGLGIGRMGLKKLVEKFGVLRSDHQGMTSDDAAKAWKSIGGIQLWSSDRGMGRSHYAAFLNKDDEIAFIAKQD